MNGAALNIGARVRMNATGLDTPLVYEVVDAPRPALTGREVLVEIEACGVCHRDLLDRAGRFPFQQTPITPGHEAAGRVVAIGPDVRDFTIGDRVGTMHRDSCGECPQCLRGETSLCDRAAWVFGILADGGYAQTLVAPESALFPLPNDLDASHAAVMHCTLGTAYRDLVTLGKLARGESVLITGANGGVGSAAVQIGARLGAEVYAVVRSDAYAEMLKGLGAHHVIVDPGNTIHQTMSTRVDVALDTVGAATFPSALRCLRPGGRIVVVGNIQFEKVGLNLGYLITSGLSITGGSGAVRREMAELIALHRQKAFDVPIDRKMPLAHAEKAHALVRAGGLRGRIVLQP